MDFCHHPHAGQPGLHVCAHGNRTVHRGRTARLEHAKQPFIRVESITVTLVHTVFQCQHEIDIDVDVDDDTEIPTSVPGLGACPDCKGESNTIPVPGIAPKPGGKDVVLDSILMISV
jgi:hypothetical protein